MTVRLATMVTLGACGRFAFDPTAISDDASDANDAPEASTPFLPNGGFANPVVLQVPFGADPQLSADGLTLWMTYNGSASIDAISVLARSSTTAVFGPSMIEAPLETASSETDPAVSGDGLVIMYVTNFSQLWEARRASSTAAWGVPAPVAGLESVAVRSADLGPGGNVIFFEAGDSSLRRAMRTDRTSAFDLPRVISAPAMGWMTVSADERLLFGNRVGGTGTVWAARGDASEPFVDQGDLAIGGACATADAGDADINADGTRLVLRCGGSLYLLTHE